MYKVIGINHPRIGGPDVITPDGEFIDVLMKALPSVDRYEMVRVVDVDTGSAYEYPRESMKSHKNDRYLIVALAPDGHIHVDGAAFASELGTARHVLKSKGYRAISHHDRRFQIPA